MKLDLKLIEKCKSGDRQAQKVLYLHSKERLKAIALRYCPVVQDAQDVVQSAYLKIFRSISRFDISKGDFNSWSAKIVVNEALMMLRRTKAFGHTLELNDDAAATASHFDILTLKEVHHIVDLMNTTHRVMFNLYFFDQFTYKEIAESLNIKEPAARARVSRARKDFNKIWKKFNQSTLKY